MGFNPFKIVNNLTSAVVNVVKKVVNVVTSVVGEVISWFIPIPDQPNLENESRGALVNKQSNIEQIPVIYGQRRVGGTIVFVETSGSSNTYLYLCLVLCEGEIEEIGDIYIDDVLLDASSRHNSYVSVDKKLGSDSQAASTVLLDAPSWTSTDTLSGIAYLGIRLTYNADVFNGIPTINAVVKGRKVFDPRTSTTAYSNNPALCLRDYLTNSRYGKGLPSSVIDDVTFSAAANDCDIDVDSYDGGPSVKAFSCNSYLITSNSLFNNVKVLLSGMQGIMPYQNGQYRLFIEKEKASTFDFTTDNIIGGISITGTSKSSKYNKITAKFVNPDANWQADSVVWPEADSTEASDFLAEDNNVELSSELNLTTVTNYYQARNIAKTAVLASRLAGLRVNLLATSEALNCVVGDVVTITHPTPGWDGKEFRLTRLSLNYDGTVSASMVEHIAAVYPWVKDKVQPVSAQSTLPNPYVVGEVTDIRFDTTTNYTEQYGAIEWDCEDLFVARYKVVVDGKNAKFDLASSAKDTGVELFGRAKRTTMINGKPYLLGFIIVDNPEVLTIDKYVAGSYIRVYGSYVKTVDWDGALTEYGTLITGVQQLSDNNLRIDIQCPLKAYEVYKASWGGGLFLRDDSAGGTGLIVTQAITPKDPSINVYYEQEVTQKYFNGINFVSGSYIVSVTPYNYLGVAGSTTSSWLYIPYPPIPSRVSGLELDLGAEGEANATTWTGKDVKIKWRQASFTLSNEINDTEPNGAEYGANDEYLKDYKVAVYKADGTLLREEYVTTTSYVYSFEKNAEDAAKRGDRAYRTVSFKVWARGKQNQISEQAATL